MLFWLQVIDVKRTQYQGEYKLKCEKAAEEGTEPPPPPRPLKKMSEEKTKQMGLIVSATGRPLEASWS